MSKATKVEFEILDGRCVCPGQRGDIRFVAKIGLLGHHKDKNWRSPRGQHAHGDKSKEY